MECYWFWKDTITINHTITQSNGKLVIRDKTKTKSSKRTLPLEPIVKSFLLELKEKQEKNKELCGDSYNQEYLEYICVDNCGNLIRPDYVTETFLKLFMKEIQAWLGHSNYNTTANLYAHLDTSSVCDTGKVITNVFSTKKDVSSA